MLRFLSWCFASIFLVLLAGEALAQAAPMREGGATGRVADSSAVDRPIVANAAGTEREPGAWFQDCPGCPEMVVVPAGTFAMGSPSFEPGRYGNEGPIRQVTIPARFAVGRHEVTRRQFGFFVEATGRPAGRSCRMWDGGRKGRPERGWLNPGYRQTGRHPVVCVSWEDANAYAEWLSRRTGKHYRLLTEAEWEYAARAGSRTARYWGEEVSGQCAHANGADRRVRKEPSYKWLGWKRGSAPCDDGHARTAPVGGYSANGFGLHDMLGNVWEWVEDCWHGSYAAIPLDGRAWKAGEGCGRRVLRGGSWGDLPKDLRSAMRYGKPPDRRHDYLGFRVARALAR